MAAFVGQVIVPMASHLAAPEERGRVVGTVMSGLLIGILISRTVSGVIAQLFGWRCVFVVVAVAMLVLAVILWRTLPRVAPTTEMPYRAALRSVVALIGSEPLLRQRMLLGACLMGSFSILWTSVAFLLTGVHGSSYHYGNAAIGLFGLAGIAGAGAAQLVGRLSDSGHGKLMTTVTLVALAASWGVLYLGAHSVILLILGIMLLDWGVQGTHVGNQSAIYQLRADARSRLTTAYMCAYFVGGTICSALTGALYDADGWSAVCIFGAAVPVLALVVWALTARRIGLPADHA